MNGFQATSSAQGRDFEECACGVLKHGGYEITERNVERHGFEIDIIARDATGDEWMIECKGSIRGKTPGSRRGDTVKKAVGVAAVLHRRVHASGEPYRYMLLTSHLPTPGTMGAAMLRDAIDAGWFTDVREIGMRSFEPQQDVHDDIGDDE